MDCPVDFDGIKNNESYQNGNVLISNDDEYDFLMLRKKGLVQV
jgi:hypothetical protein